MRGVSGKRTGALAVILAVTVFAMPSPASAGPRVNCEASGRVNITGQPGAWNWSLNGLGLCVDYLAGRYQVGLEGSGTSDSFGLCAPRRGIDPDGVHGLVVRNLRLDVVVTLVNLKTGVVRQINETWGSPVTTFPVATPFVIGGAGAPGLGSIFTRIFLGCPPGGSPAATFTWTQVT
jgi:hypothetical protein